jgi:hypothetical protein
VGRWQRRHDFPARRSEEQKSCHNGEHQDGGNLEQRAASTAESASIAPGKVQEDPRHDGRDLE